MMFIVSLIEFSKHVQNEISAKVMPKPQNFTADFAEHRRCRVPKHRNETLSVAAMCVNNPDRSPLESTADTQISPQRFPPALATTARARN